jgi:hypothetical protein
MTQPPPELAGLAERREQPAQIHPGEEHVAIATHHLEPIRKEELEAGEVVGAADGIVAERASEGEGLGNASVAQVSQRSVQESFGNS